MTCRSSEINWLDVLYTAVRQAPGGVESAARFLSERRGRSIHRETLRAKLRGADGESISVEMAELLTEWMEDMRCPDAHDWVHAFCGRWGLVATRLDACAPEQVGLPALMAAHMETSKRTGAMAQEILAAAEDGVLDEREAEAIEAQAREGQRALEELIVISRRAARRGQ
ncbi:MAG: hypothetical protein E2576_14415 [Alcaligenaceae bacterium]|nr:hypothetical protein [Alcaligenaceae bacterium SAGV5]MPS50426.1 hypothetical protein [Alcaligenaceae bacterium SAGV3]MPT57913.1 hypothetical protein [Alcaligenaceae bacterium]